MIGAVTGNVCVAVSFGILQACMKEVVSEDIS